MIELEPINPRELHANAESVKIAIQCWITEVENKKLSIAPSFLLIPFDNIMKDYDSNLAKLKTMFESEKLNEDPKINEVYFMMLIILSTLANLLTEVISKVETL